MPKNIRVATFNCENLFSRPLIFEENKKDSLQLLKYVSQLQEELRKEVFDQKVIKELKKELKGYITINDIRGKHDKVSGSNEWLGSIDFIRSPFLKGAIENTARVINDVNADVICLVEVEDRPTLQKFHDDLLYPLFLKKDGKPRYEYIFLIDGNDPRGIDVSIMSRLPIQWIRSHINDAATINNKLRRIFSRDCLEVQVELSDKKFLHILVNHLKSMGYNFSKDDPKGDILRKIQAQRVAELIDTHNLKNEYVIVAGDLNSYPDSASLFPLLNKENLYNVNLELEPSERWTYKQNKKQIDYLIVSDALKKKLGNVCIERRGIFTKTGKHYDEVKNDLTAASDHAALSADFQL